MYTPGQCRGLEKTREAVVERELEVLEQVETFSELRDVLENLYLSLENLNIFTAINLTAAEPPVVSLCPACNCPSYLCMIERKLPYVFSPLCTACS